MHIGLFGYSREIGSVRLPRAINFTAALYSVGIPPEILGLSSLSSLTDKEYERLNEAGRVFYSEMGKLKLPFVPNTYEVAVTPEEFFG